MQQQVRSQAGRGWASPPAAALASRSGGKMDPRWAERVGVPAVLVEQFTRQLALLINSGIPLARCLDILQEQAEHPEMTEVLWTVGRDLHNGRRLSAAFATFPRVFPHTYSSLIRVAESTGRLAASLTLLADWLEREARQRHQLRSALAYPALVLGLTVVLSLWLSLGVLPPILDSLTGLGGSLPLPTRILVTFVHAARNPLGVAVMLALLGAGLGSGYGLWRRPSPALVRSWWVAVAGIPLLRTAWRDAAVIRYCAACDLLLSGGADLLISLRLSALASGSPLLQEDYPRLRRRIEEAGSVGACMAAERGLYGTLLPGLVEGCEEIGSLDRAFRRTRMALEDEVAYRFSLFQQALEPLLLAVMASVVLFFLLAVLLPLYAQLQRF